MHELLPPGDEPGERRVFAIVDAARDDTIYPSLLRAGGGWSCLYRGDAAVRLAEVAPYLVELHVASAHTRWVIEQGWGNSWGIFVITRATPEMVRSHFRRFLLVQLPDGRTVYFRFYDPRVLGAYLPSCQGDELRTLFGPVECFVVENDDGATAVLFRREGDALVAKTISREIAVRGLLRVAATKGRRNAVIP